VLVDPYAKLVEGRRYFGDISMKLSKFLGTYDFDSLPFDWGENYKPPNISEVFSQHKCLPFLVSDIHHNIFARSRLCTS